MHIIRLPPGASEDHKIHDVEPVYPQMGIAYIQGDVLLDVIISKQGDVKSLSAVSGHPILIQAARDAVKQWKYRPFYDQRRTG
jgi:protein TonB